MRNRTAVSALIALALLVVAAPAALAVEIAQRHPYQKTLRDYFATLTEADFTVELKPVAYVEDYFKDMNTVARYWALFVEGPGGIPSNVGIRVAPRLFTLAAIEEGNAVNISSGQGAFMDPKDAAWWTQWEYPGNPYINSRPLKLRACVVAVVDMIMQDEDHENGRNLRPDYLGGSMLRYAYTYRVARDVLPQNVQKAYAEGLVRMFEKLEKTTPRGPGGSDMEFFQLSSMWYAADALGGDFMPRALARAHRVIDTITSKTGYEKHGGAFDVSYQGIALRFLTWGAMLYKDAKVNEALHKMLVLKSYLTLPEPGGELVGPTHFNTGTAADAPGDQWAWVSRDYAMGMVDDLALYTVWARIGVPTEEKMRAAVKKGIEGIGGTEESNAVPAPWHEVHWNRTLIFAYECYKPGYYQRLVELAEANSPLTKPLYSRGERFIRDLNGGGEFLAAQFDDYATVVHTGAIAAHWAGGVSGKSGGEVSAFWTPAGGTAILGRCRATQSPAGFDEWIDEHNRGPYTWAVHAITGKGAGGHYFSTARIRDIKSTYDIDDNTSAVVTISGDLAGSNTADPNDELRGSVLYNREFRIDKTGVAVTSGLTGDGSDKMPELWETIPVHVGPMGKGPKAPATTVDLRVGGEWTPATATLAEADQVRITRYGKPVYIILEKPHRIKMNGPFEPGAHGGAAMRVMMIDLTGAQNPTIRYRITATP